jgi:hypothetical protein
MDDGQVNPLPMVVLFSTTMASSASTNVMLSILDITIIKVKQNKNERSEVLRCPKDISTRETR